MENRLAHYLEALGILWLFCVAALLCGWINFG